MIDRRTQIMSWLEGLTFDDWPMFHSDSEVQEIAKDALELLKEYEPIKPIDIERKGDFATGLCPKCETWINKYDHAKACGRCGQAVKWND